MGSVTRRIHNSAQIYRIAGVKGLRSRLDILCINVVKSQPYPSLCLLKLKTVEESRLNPSSIFFELSSTVFCSVILFSSSILIDTSGTKEGAFFLLESSFAETDILLASAAMLECNSSIERLNLSDIALTSAVSLLINHEKTLDDLSEALGLDKMKEEIAQLEKEQTVDGFWDDIANSQKVVQRTSNLKSKVAAYEKLRQDYDDALVMIELSNEEEDEGMLDECTESVEKFESDLDTMTLTTLLSGEYDAKNAILTFHAGAGGTEAQDWAQMLFRMYCRWGERHGFKVTTLDFLDGDEAGLKSASILIEGENAYGFMKSETGIHRLVRVSPFDAAGRRHTSFASVEVMPEIDDTVEVEIAPEDIKMDVYRSSGAGGQKVNKTSSAVRLTHIPTGIVVACQVERSQHQNREVAMRMLKSKLLEIKEREHLDKISDIKGDQKEIGWGNQIRSYVFMPYTLVKDNRTGYEMGNINAVMDGDIDGFINAYLKMQSQKKLEE